MMLLTPLVLVVVVFFGPQIARSSVTVNASLFTQVGCFQHCPTGLTGTCWNAATLQMSINVDCCDKCPTGSVYIAGSGCEYPCRVSCFPGDSLVIAENGKGIPLHELSHGMLVQTANVIGSEPILDFLHADAEAFADYWTFELANGASFSASADHLIFVNVEKLAKRASEVVVMSDRVWYGVEAPEMVLVQSRRKERKRGVYSPLTNSGTLIVNNVHVSAYAFPIFSHEVMHMTMSPYRLFRSLFPLSPSNETSAKLSSRPKGILPYAAFFMGLMESLEWV